MGGAITGNRDGMEEKQQEQEGVVIHPT